jgi:threonine dehydrogenase-like Zn-dependent dehydrogenase
LTYFFKEVRLLQISKFWKEVDMLAMNYRGPYRIPFEEKPRPTIEHPNDAIVSVTRSCIYGSDLHLYHGPVPDTRVGTTFGHAFTGIVEESGLDSPDVCLKKIESGKYKLEIGN